MNTIEEYDHENVEIDNMFSPNGRYNYQQNWRIT